MASKSPRAAPTYRAARRNAARGTVWRGVVAKQSYVPPVRLNRSRKWDGVPLTKPYR